MEEKKRYQLVEEDFAYAIVDNEEHKTYQDDCFDFFNICDLLNQQDMRIKELEEANGYIIFVDGYDENGNEIYKQEYKTYKDRFKELLKENQQLKQQLTEKEKEICSKQYMFDGYISQATLKKHIDNQIKQLKEKNND